MTEKSKKGLILLGIILIAGWFYWFQFRPTKIRSYCDWKVRNDSYWRVNTKIYDIYYQACLHEKGLK